MKIKVEVFGALKDFFNSEQNIEISAASSIEDLNNELIKQKSDSKNLLSNCRYAVNNEMTSETFILQEGHIVSILPPASGG